MKRRAVGTLIADRGLEPLLSVGRQRRRILKGVRLAVVDEGRKTGREGEPRLRAGDAVGTDVLDRVGPGARPVGEADLPVMAIRRFAPASFIIGASLGSDAELPNAKDADYVGVGPVYGSESKNDAGTAIGVEGFKRLAALVNHPAIAVGGITADRALQITVNGAAGVAVINAIFKADDPESATRAIAAAIGK